MKFFWDAKYSVQIKSIDSQHQKFFEIINKIYYLNSNDYLRLTRVKLAEVVGELAEYANLHFVFEEKYFKEYDFSEKKEHKKGHDSFRTKVKKYLAELKKDDIKVMLLSDEIAEFTSNWLSEHILGSDHKYIGLFLKNGLR